MFTSLAESVFPASEKVLLSQNLHDFLQTFASTGPEYPCGPLPETPSTETPSSTPSTQEAPPNSPPNVPDKLSPPPQMAVIWSASPSSSPLPQTPTFPPPNWNKIPQNVYKHGRKQWNFVPLESISFTVKGYPGVNLGDALRRSFTGLDARDELVLQNTSSAISCRFLVSSS